MNSAGQKKLVLSPDTDVYMNSADKKKLVLSPDTRLPCCLPIVAVTSLDVLVQLSPFSSLVLHLLDMQALITSFANDPDMASIPPTLSSSAIQVLYLCTGCDFFVLSWSWKSFVLSTCFEYCGFICSQ